ncbi:uncharacterized protein TrAtP1_010393 [Trichoderma atroviride]|uniref:uncharacterized protein n=1 Tax=Hypocrea atroviridis TaxID=63577 RepID=UPI00331D274D|nr:hypothetical protein TrAtP1_010393 [Trichoderma atroviride]
MSISDLSKECQELFNRRLVSAASAPKERTAIENHLFRFNLWVKFYAAPYDKRDSLDCRLRKAMVPRSLMLDLLRDLLEALNSDSSIIAPTSQASAIDGSPQSVGDASSNENPETVGDIMIHLLRYTRAIHRSGIMRSLVEVPNHFEYDEKTGENITVKSISSKKAALESTEPAPQASSYSAHSCDNTQRALQANWIRTHGTRTAPPVQTATAVDSNQLPRMNTILEQKTAENMAANLPRRPKVPVGQTEFECPYCFVVCPVEEYTKENWPRHIIKDLAPFICVQESCPTPDTMYESHEDWISHMETKHAPRGWACYDESHDSVQYFEDEQSFRRHAIEHHGGDMTEDELTNLTKECECLLPFQPFKSCPFCNEYTDDASITLDEHITLHLLYLSQVSIPGDFLEMRSVEFESEEEILSSGACLEGSKLSQKNKPDSVSSVRTPKRGTSASSSINNPKLLKTNEDATLTELVSLAKKREGKNQYHTPIEAVGEPSADDSSVVGLEMASCMHNCSVSPNMGLSDDIIEPPTIEHTPGEPDIWDRLQVRESLQAQ